MSVLVVALTCTFAFNLEQRITSQFMGSWGQMMHKRSDILLWMDTKG